jgi:DNA-binding transcriptional MerR regulator
MMTMIKIPDKMFFRIGDVSSITGVKPYVLRYWESEFKSLRPVKNRAGQRVYRRKDVNLILEIKRLLYEQKFTIAGAKKKIEENRKGRIEPAQAPDAAQLMTLLKKVHRELSVINELLK